MPRTKKALPRNSSLLPGTTLNPDTVRYLEVMVDELQCSLDTSVATAKAIASQICRQVDVWYDSIIRVVPEDILNRPYMEVLESGFQIPTPDTAVLSAALSVTLSATTSVAEHSAHSKSPASTQPRLKKLSASAKARRAPSQRGSMAGGKKGASDESAGSKPRKTLRKSTLRTPSMTHHTVNRRPVVTPKFDIRKRPTTARKARQGETLLSLVGSPVNTKQVETPVHVHVDNGKVVKLTADISNNSSIQKLCKAIQKLCNK